MHKFYKAYHRQQKNQLAFKISLNLFALQCIVINTTIKNVAEYRNFKTSLAFKRVITTKLDY